MRIRMLVPLLTIPALAVSADHALAAVSYYVTDIRTLGDDFVFGANNAGQVVGYHQVPDSGYRHAALWSNGVMTDLGTFGGKHSEAHGINDNGQVVGWAENPGNTYRHGFLWHNGAMADIGALGGADSVALGANNAGQVVGYSQVADSGYCHAFLWHNGVMADLATFGGKHSEAHGINDSGQVVGWAEGPDNTYRHAFLWQNGVMVDLNDLPLANGGSTGWEFHDATAINSQGQIVAYGSQDGQGRALLLTPAPGLPAFVLVGVAPIVGGIVRRLRRR